MCCPTEEDGVKAKLQLKLTKATLAGLSLPPGEDGIVWDTEIPGFGLRYRKSGAKGWVFGYRVGGRGGKQPKIPLGEVSAVSPADARAAATKLYARTQLGEDPAGEKARAEAKSSETVGAALQRFLARQRGRLKPRYYAEVERHLLVQARSLHRLPLDTVTRRTIAPLLTTVGESAGPAAANRLRASLSAFFVWAMREGLTEQNPVADTNRHEESGSRERVLTEDEWRPIWAGTAGDDQYSAIVRLSSFTLARRDEIGGLRWSEVDFDRAVISLRAKSTKNWRPFEIPLSAPALEILRKQPRREGREFVFGRGQGGFSGWSKSKAELDARARVSGWRLHDLRRSGSTAMHGELGIQPHIVEAVLNHVSGHRSGVAGVYNRSPYEADKRRALDLWAAYLLALVEGHESKVVALRA
jgi:integrase